MLIEPPMAWPSDLSIWFGDLMDDIDNNQLDADYEAEQTHDNYEDNDRSREEI